MRIAMTILAVSLAFGAGCKKKKTEPAPTTDMGSGAGSTMAGSSMAGSDMGSAMAGSDMGSGSGGAMAGSDMGSGAGSGSDMAEQKMMHKAGNCPSTVLGSTTKVDVKGKAVVVTVTSDDADAVKAIQKRAASLLAEKKDGTTGSQHDQKGTHGGGMGLCPIYVPEGATATAKNEKKGVAVTITPKENPADLKTEIDGRVTKAADWVKENIKPGDKANEGGVGGGKGDDGMNRSGSGDGKGIERKKAGGDGKGGGAGTGGGGGKGTGGGDGKGEKK